jgi:hypothetical protein
LWQPPRYARRFAQPASDTFLRENVVATGWTTDDRHKPFRYGVLEYKSTNGKAAPPGCLTRLGLRPLKLSKFLWTTDV